MQGKIPEKYDEKLIETIVHLHSIGLGYRKMRAELERRGFPRLGKDKIRRLHLQSVSKEASEEIEDNEVRRLKQLEKEKAERSRLAKEKLAIRTRIKDLEIEEIAQQFGKRKKIFTDEKAAFRFIRRVMPVIDAARAPLAKDGLALADDLEKAALGGLESVDYTWISFLHLGCTQFDTLGAIISLLERENDKDCFSLLRSVFESYFFLLLMMYGKRFRETRRFRIVPKEGRDATIARDRTLEKWRVDWKSGDPKYTKVVHIEKENADLIRVTIEDEGLYRQDDHERKGSIVTRYYFAFEEYDPEIRFVARLPSVCAGDPYPEITDRNWRQQKTIYNQYFHVPHLVGNLRMNNLLNDEQTDRFEVHYSFLSMFIHPTRPGTVRISKTTYQHPYTPEVLRIARHELVLLYVCKLESLLMQTVVRYFHGINPRADFHHFEAQAKLLEEASRDLWFIYDTPTAFDIKQSEYLTKTATALGYSVPDESILYYRDPLKRLADYMMSQGILSP